MNELEIKAILSVVCIAIFVLIRRSANTFISRRSQQNEFSQSRTTNVKNLVFTALFILCLLALGTIWEITIQGLAVYFASFFAIVGVAFFAAWSALSNVTAAIILFFNFPIRVGYRVRIQDGDNSAEGTIVNISLFNIQIQRVDGNVIYYPNNLALQKPIIQMGKLGEEYSSRES